MVLYLDTSALVKRYFEEESSDVVLSLWGKAGHIVTSSVAYSETLACFYRKKNEPGFDDNVFAKILDEFREDWSSFIRVQVNDGLNPFIDQVFACCHLRGFDAVHLASAVLIREKLTKDLVFACYDSRLNKAAKLQGLEILESAGSDV